ncbi:glycosyltransferase, partial [bacterium]|nr:glycosyltransferase [bacterium]
MMRTLVIVPTHNEAENIGALLDALNFHVGDADVLVIDDASNDDTRSIVRGRLDAHDGYLQLVERDEKRGLGDAYVYAFAIALDQ